MSTCASSSRRALRRLVRPQRRAGRLRPAGRGPRASSSSARRDGWRASWRRSSERTVPRHRLGHARELARSRDARRRAPRRRSPTGWPTSCSGTSTSTAISSPATPSSRCTRRSTSISATTASATCWRWCSRTAAAASRPIVAGDGYYDADGRPLQKLFLRSPLPYSRITSSFSHRRFHPVLKSYRPHYGVDYGAPVGTPVRATASGVVALGRLGRRRRQDGEAAPRRRLPHRLPASLALRHRDARPGERVAQGDVIGYVGATGLATGPHLDYRVQHRGRWIDPTSLARAALGADRGVRDGELRRGPRSATRGLACRRLRRARRARRGHALASRPAAAAAGGS